MDGDPGGFNDFPANEGRNARRGPDFFRIDLGIAWDAVPTGGRNIGLTLNIHNVFNTTNLDPESVVTNLQAGPLFGQALGALPKRQIELGVQIR